MLNITKIPISKTSLNFTPTQQLQSSKSSNNYGGFGSKQAQNQALTNAIQASQKKYPDQFIDKKTGKTYSYVNKTIQKTQAQNPMKLQKLKTTPKIQLQSFGTKFQKQQQGPVQPLKTIPTMQGPVGISKSKSKIQSQQQQPKQQQSYNEYSGNVPGQIADKLLDTVVEMGQGQKNIVEDYYNIPGQIAGSGYEDKSLINQAGAKVFEGDFEGAGKTIISNLPQLAGELSVEIPLAVIPIGPALKLGKIGVQAVKTGVKILSDPVVIKNVSKVKLQMLENAIDAVNKGKSGAVKTVNVITKDIQKVTDKVRKDTYYQIIDKDRKSMWYSKGKPESFYLDKHIGDGAIPALRKVKVNKTNAKKYLVDNLINTRSIPKRGKTVFGGVGDEIEHIGIDKQLFNTLTKSNKQKHIGKQTVDNFIDIDPKHNMMKDTWKNTKKNEIGSFVERASRDIKNEWAFPLEIQKKSKTIAIGVNNIAKKTKKIGFTSGELPKHLAFVEKTTLLQAKKQSIALVNKVAKDPLAKGYGHSKRKGFNYTITQIKNAKSVNEIKKIKQDFNEYGPFAGELSLKPHLKLGGVAGVFGGFGQMRVSDGKFEY